MALDGSFSLEFALQRFLARCPKLGAVPRFVSLSGKGSVLTDEEVVGSIAELFLHPKYTITLIGCFRPIAQKIVEKAIALLRVVPNLLSGSEDAAYEPGYLDDEFVNIIEFHIQNGRGLDLHELACLAICRSLDLVPTLLGSVLMYFTFAPAPFGRILTYGAHSAFSAEVIARHLHSLRLSYRLLMVEPEAFSKLWDWSCLFNFVNKFVYFDPSSDVEVKDMVDVRWCAVQIMTVILDLGDKSVENFGIGAEEAHSCFLRWDDFCQDTAAERAGAYLGSSDQGEMKFENGNLYVQQDSYFQSFGFNSLASLQSSTSEPPTKCRGLVKWDDKPVGSPFVVTSTVRRSWEMSLLSVSQKWPVLLYGPPGAGKSALISKMAQESGNQVLSIHVDDQIDGKTLVGSYVCAEQPGEFRWRPGSLTQAVLDGLWVVFEDIDRVPMDVLSILLPLLEGSGSFMIGNGEEVRAADSFRLFATVSTSRPNVCFGMEGRNFGGALWRKVMVPPPNDQDLQMIIKAWYPSLEPLASKLVETFEGVRAIPLHQFLGSHSAGSSSIGYACRFSLRDLLKWCKRIAGNVYGLLPYDCYRIYQEAVDVFAAFLASAQNRMNIMKELARLWGVPTWQEETLYPHNEPIIQETPSELMIGRVALQRLELKAYNEDRPFVKIRSSLYLLERIACSVKYNEPVLLVGETGTGKTTLVQNLARKLGQNLTVLNLSQQSDVADLLGGFKPMDAHSICVPLFNEFKQLFAKMFSVKENDKFFTRLQELLYKKNWEKLLYHFKKSLNHIERKLEENGSYGKKRKKPSSETKKGKYLENFTMKLEAAHRQITSSGMVFTFVEGAFVTALRNGQWILLDEVNLAPPEVLQRLIGVLEGENGSFPLPERGDVTNVCRHPNFRIFACMNPATDAGKRDLPSALRSRFTEYFVDDILDDRDLDLFIRELLADSKRNSELVERIRCFYKAAKRDSEERLQDGANQKPQYSLRSLFRALEFARKGEKRFGFQNAIYDGFSMFFVTLLDRPSAKIIKQKILQYLLDGNKPSRLPFSDYLHVLENSMVDKFIENYVLTKTVQKHLRNLSRAIFIKRYPVLLQGPTSSGKTSLVRYLASITGHEFVRINNHEHTDLQEYLGSYITDSSGKLVFHEGVLVKAVRNGHWIVLDELNLAPSDVLEALNRLLDDNRELFVPELRETIHAHPDFMLFATQNPPTVYGGRKMLSRAFRNRFVEIHVDEIPEDELSTILKQRCRIPESYAKKMVDVMKELQLHRQSSKVFAGKHGYITPRDLFRWADRFQNFGKSYDDLALDGYYLLAERLRDSNEKILVQEVLEKHLRVKLVKDNLYKQELLKGDPLLNWQEDSSLPESLQSITLTESMRRLYFLVRRCYELHEPVLLVGETGGGKTTVCQLLSVSLGLNLHILNCHQYTETSDFLGGFYPVRDRSKLVSEFDHLIENLRRSKVLLNYPLDIALSSNITLASSILQQLDLIISNYREGVVSDADVSVHDIEVFEEMKMELAQLHQKWLAIFIWHDGPLVKAMKAGDLFLIDEISLADDSVLERLNSVLEPERNLSLPEKGGIYLENITADRNFLVLATMNPGGDYGKKELSPALRNRFTEIWVPPVSDLTELRSIALRRLRPPEPFIVDSMLTFWDWFSKLHVGRALTVRDLLSWVGFIDVAERKSTIKWSPSLHCFQGQEKLLKTVHAFLHGGFLVLLDGLSLGTGMSKEDCKTLRQRCFSFLLQQPEVHDLAVLHPELQNMERYGWVLSGTAVDIVAPDDDVLHHDLFGINPFYVERGPDESEIGGFKFIAPTTRRNALRVLRAMQLSKPVLLEGSPGVGKTSLIVALGKSSGHRVVRINLSEQTDMMDLLGSDLPVESDEEMKFAWSDGILLQAIKDGCWVLLDELNLAPQSVLEGLNAILDHRAEVFIPELGRTFTCPPSFRLFACQNPSHQGGGRKGLPKSFLNRFTKVYIDELVAEDYLSICSSLYPTVPASVISKLISFNKCLYEETMLNCKFGQSGAPWEFNLRDVMRSCQIIEGAPDKVGRFLDIVYLPRMRTAADRKQVLQLYEQIFAVRPFSNPYPRVHLNSHFLVVGDAAIQRKNHQSSKILGNQLKILPGIRNSLEVAAHCVQKNWLCILIGPSSAGKTSLIRLLAHLTGNVLKELNLSPATDISELLGCFEQYNPLRNFRSVVSQVDCFVKEYSSFLLESSVANFLGERNQLIARWLVFLSILDRNLISSSFGHIRNQNSLKTSLSLLAEIVAQLDFYLKEDNFHVSWSSHDLSRVMDMILKLQSNWSKPQSVKFEWVTGSLLKAIENGEWVILENANLCNPSVLDRINSLVEPGGAITISECGSIDGKPIVLRPHPGFRMFLSVNPSFGEVSRAMRNRGVEIFMMEPDWIFNEKAPFLHEGLEVKDAMRFLALAGVPGGKLVESMAKAHAYARLEGLRHNVQITYRELAFWAQLFQQLIMSGNQPIWSLHVSWEHTYLSALGEVDGVNIINHANSSFLSGTDICISDLSSGAALCLPGGWPAPLKLRDMTWYSKEITVKQNCMYLEFLGAQYASIHQHKVRFDICSKEMIEHAGTCIQDWKSLAEKMHSTVYKELSSADDAKTQFDPDTANKMMWFAANWAIEQATENDLMLYLQRLCWFASNLEPYCPFFRAFLTILQLERKHPIWTVLIRCRQELLSLHQIDLDMHPIPMLSLELIDFSSPVLSNKLLHDSIHCVGLLRLSYQQWTVESNYIYNDETRLFLPFLESVRALEENVLDTLVGSSSFDKLFRMYTNLIEDHILFWKGLTSGQYEKRVFYWQSLLKDVGRLKKNFPAVVRTDLMSMNQGDISHFLAQTERSLLWSHGGHPYLPSSEKLYDHLCQLFLFCESVWPIKRNVWQRVVDGILLEIVASLDPELRFFALQGVSMSPFIVSKCDEDDSQVTREMEKMLEMLLKKFECERNKLLCEGGLNRHGIPPGDSASCCVFSSETLRTRSGFENWVETRPINDSISFSLDLESLLDLSSLLVANDSKLLPGLHDISAILDSSLKYSLTFSSRSPQSFAPHQKILWVLDAWESVEAVDAKVAGFVLEMWFCWHSFLWNYHPPSIMNFLAIDIPLPHLFVQPIKTATVAHMLKSLLPIKEFDVHLLKLKVVSSDLWQSPYTRIDLPSFISSVTRCLFQQIICAHKRSFDADKFSAIKSMLSSPPKYMEEENVQLLSSYIASSSHKKLKSLMHLFVEPLLKGLYLQCSPTDVYSTLGSAWLRIGGMRLHLLLGSDGMDPTIKYSFKLSRVEEKIFSLELDTKVRQECDYLAGLFSASGADKKITDGLEELKSQHRRLRTKIVFRPDPTKFKLLKKECDEFLELVNSSIYLVSNMKEANLQELVDRVSNWQETAISFVNRLSNEYTDYVDIAQPVQVAIYEMKLGLSLVFSSAVQKNFLRRLQEDDMSRILDSIYSFMRFPRGSTSGSLFVCEKSMSQMFFCTDTGSARNSCVLDLNLLEKLVNVSSDFSSEKASALQHKAAFNHNILVRVAQSLAASKLLDKQSFGLLDEIFSGFASMWMTMKIDGKDHEEHATQAYKYRPRVFKIDSVMEIDVSALAERLANDNFVEWQALLSEEETTEQMEDGKTCKNLEDEWNQMLDSILYSLINVHSQLFGSVDLMLAPGSFQISDADIVWSFITSYSLGVGMIKGFGGLFASSLDPKLVLEHVLRVCLEHKQECLLPHQKTGKYNFYKDSNAPVMTSMVKLLGALQQHVSGLLSEWEEHPGLQKVLDVITMLLSIPSSTPLAKAVSGLQFLLNRSQILQEYGSKFSLSVYLDPIVTLVCSWQRMEYESWPVLLDEVQDQYEMNAVKLWFPLYSVLHQEHSSDIDSHNQSTTRSLEEFVQTSSIGEFRKRLQLLFAFLGQMNAGRKLGTYSSHCVEENVKILYNLFGFYVQFLPMVMEHILDRRRSIEAELKHVLKLLKWDRIDDLISFETARKNRQKMKKLIQKFSDMLQKPIMLFLNQELVPRAGKDISLLGPNIVNDISNKCISLLSSILDSNQFKDELRFSWYASWRSTVDCSFHNMEKEFDLYSMCTEAKIRQHTSPQSVTLPYQENWVDVWHTLERICSMALDCGVLWKDESRNVSKRRALFNLLELLESSGLNRRMFEILEISNPSSWLFLQPQYDAEHLLVTCGAHASAVQKSEWITVNEFYFKSLVSMKLLQESCMKLQEDFTSEQAKKSISYMYHLIVIQQMQRAAVYRLAKLLERLQGYDTALGRSYVSKQVTDDKSQIVCAFPRNQIAIFKCLWQQKQLFDSMTNMLLEESLLLKTIESTHSCERVRPDASKILCFIEESIPLFVKSKDSIDSYLIGGNQVITSLDVQPYVVSEEMEQLVIQNMQIMKEFEGNFVAMLEQASGGSSAVRAVFNHFEDAFKKAKLLADEFSMSELTNESEIPNSDSCAGECPELHHFDESVRGTLRLIVDVLEKLNPSNIPGPLVELSSGGITAWEPLFEFYVTNLGVDTLCNNLHETIDFAKKLMSHSGNKIPNVSSHVGAFLRNVHVFLDLVVSFAHDLLREFLVMHKTVSIMTYALSNIFTDLYAKGLGASAEDLEDDTGHDVSKEASGTGMGEGVGLNDVSDQITDEDQLLGTEKTAQEQDAPNEIPSKDDKGIEMEQDFKADTYSVSEDSSEDNDEESENEELESTMGEAGGDSKVVDEKLQEEDEDEVPNQKNEKYESGPSVKDADTSNRELRAKEDSTDTETEEEQQNPGEVEKNGETENKGADDENDTVEDMNLDNEETFSDPSALKPDELEHRVDDLECREDSDPDEEEKLPTNGDCEEDNPCPADETMEEAGTELGDGSYGAGEQKEPVEGDELGEDDKAEEKYEKEVSTDGSKSGMFDSVESHTPTAVGATQPMNDFLATESKNLQPEASWANNINVHNDVVSLGTLPPKDDNDLNIMVPQVSVSGKFTDGYPEGRAVQQLPSTSAKSKTNPYRSLGDALQEWKERVNVSLDLHDINTENQHMTNDENADEYGYVSDLEKGSEQALGSATSEQVNKNISNSKSEDRNIPSDKDYITKMEVDEQNSEEYHMKHSSQKPKSKTDELTLIPEALKQHQDESLGVHELGDGDEENCSGGLVSIQNPYTSEDLLQFGKLNLVDEEMGKPLNVKNALGDVKDNATRVWRRYELLTTRLSQELAEQLRLVMEPTVASRLQGDYKSGKRINMKKVIPYIASHYRKDKIWLRRTRPNKRDYQVVIAVDDSHSMTDGRCGEVATKALVTVCRAMSQLEVGNLAVASFGKKGNIRLLHDFNEPFTSESGIKMISSLTFEQENTIEDEPVLDLLMFLNKKLDAAVANARLPSGQNPLQQLVLIIGDGRLHEKENLKAYVRDVLSSKRMVAFLILDNSDESIMDLQEVTHIPGKDYQIKFSNYLDSFPFPYYIVLRNIEALPRTLADLLRQWFELMQNARD